MFCFIKTMCILWILLKLIIKSSNLFHLCFILAGWSNYHTPLFKHVFSWMCQAKNQGDRSAIKINIQVNRACYFLGWISSGSHFKSLKWSLFLTTFSIQLIKAEKLCWNLQQGRNARTGLCYNYRLLSFIVNWENLRGN